jgi:hypothetical protein
MKKVKITVTVAVKVWITAVCYQPKKVVADILKQLMAKPEVFMQRWRPDLADIAIIFSCFVCL